MGLLLGAASLVVWAIDVTTGSFEINDGNTKVDGGTGKHDWNELNGDCTVPGGGSGSPGGSSARTCIADEVDPVTGDQATMIFTGGGSKDPADIPSWKWKPTDTVPDKDTINHAFVASYFDYNGSGDKVVFIGGDRYAVNGDANIGAWLFQQQVGPQGTS